MKEQDKIKLWLALYEEGDITDSEGYIDEPFLMDAIVKFGVPRRESKREILTLLAWGLIEYAGVGSYGSRYIRNNSWKPSLGMLFLDRMDAKKKKNISELTVEEIREKWSDGNMGEEE